MLLLVFFESSACNLFWIRPLSRKPLRTFFMRHVSRRFERISLKNVWIKPFLSRHFLKQRSSPFLDFSNPFYLKRVKTIDRKWLSKFQYASPFAKVCMFLWGAARYHSVPERYQKRIYVGWQNTQNINTGKRYYTFCLPIFLKYSPEDTLAAAQRKIRKDFNRSG